MGTVRMRRGYGHLRAVRGGLALYAESLARGADLLGAWLTDYAFDDLSRYLPLEGWARRLERSLWADYGGQVAVRIGEGEAA